MSDELQPVPEQTQEAPKHSLTRQIIEFALTFLVAILLAQAVRTWVVQPYVVPTGSMETTIMIGDHVLGNKFVYRFGTPHRGDIVILDDPTGQVGTLIKRCIAVGGQTVDLKDGKVVVDGVPLNEPYTHGAVSEPLMGSSIRFPYSVPKGSIWVMGDNREASQDSRWFGAVPASSVQGKGFFIYWPLDHFGQLN